MLVDFGFDLAGRREPGLMRGFALAVAAAGIEVAAYVELLRVLNQVVAGTATTALALEAFVFFAVAAALLVWLKASANTQSFIATYGLIADARLAIADHLSRLPMGYFTHARRGALIDLLTHRFAAYQDVITHVWGLAIVNLALPALLWVVLLVVDFRLALLTLALLPPALLAVPWAQRRMATASAKLTELRGTVATRTVEQIEGAKELRQFRGQQRRQEEFTSALAQLEHSQLEAEMRPALALLAFNFLLQFGFAVTAATATWMLVQGWIETAAMLIFLVLLVRFYRAVADLGVNLTELRFARQTLQELRQLMSQPALVEPRNSLAPVGHDVILDAVGFSYQDGNATRSLEAISGRIAEGSLVALVGASGSGKSTLAHLIARLWDPHQGSIRIGGVDLREMDAQALNSTVATVLQDVALFDATVADNIRLGRPSATDEEVMAAARAAQAHDFISKLPDGYATRLESAHARGLSGGERQRIAIARALLKQAPVLILDESTASVDLQHEAQIQHALAELTRGHTVIAIAHRLWTIVEADQIWVLEHGRIVQRGSYQTLMSESNGPFRRLWDAQTASRTRHGP